MDEAVVRSMAKWPNVPNVYGWLQLDRRGAWLIKGERITNRGVTEFIGRNYEADERGRWFFQNGPQRVFVTLEYTPFVIQTRDETAALATHSDVAIERISGAWMDESGFLLLRWGVQIGVVNDRDLTTVMRHFTDVHGKAIDDTTLARAFDPNARRHATGVFFEHGENRVPVGRIQAGEVAQKFGFDPDPRPAEGEPEC